METITIRATINASVDEVWQLYTRPEHIMKWNNASDEWCCPKTENDLRVGGKFIYRMEAKDGSEGFDFAGTYDEVKENAIISYTIDDGRNVTVKFEKILEETKVDILFEAEADNSVEMQRDGWQAILNNFKKYVEELK